MIYVTKFYTTSPFLYHHSYQLLLARENLCRCESGVWQLSSGEFGKLQLFLSVETRRTKLHTCQPLRNITSPLMPPTEFWTTYKEIVTKYKLFNIPFKFMEYNCNTAEIFSVSMNLQLGMKVLDKQMTPVSYNQGNTQKCKHCILTCEERIWQWHM
jgi:hypothetical protein